MKLLLQIEKNGRAYRLVTPDGEEIEGVSEIILPVLSSEDIPRITVMFEMAAGAIHLARDK